MARSIIANIGEKIEVKNTAGETMGYFYFNPADVDLERRCEVASKRLDEISKEIKDGTPEEIRKLNRDIRSQMEYLLGESAADTLFKYNSPLAVMPDGNIYAMYISEIIFKFIAEEVEARTRKSEKMIRKYTDKYAK